MGPNPMILQHSKLTVMEVSLLHAFYTSAGFTDEHCVVYLATGLSDADAEQDEHERIDIETRPLSELDAVIGEVRDAKTLIGLLELRRRL